MKLTRRQGISQFSDEIGHSDGHNDDREADQLNGQLESRFLTIAAIFRQKTQRRRQYPYGYGDRRRTVLLR